MNQRPPAFRNAARRVVVIDLDWQEADLLPELLERPEYAVCLVAGESAEDAGVRVAELCGIPRTLDLADVTREIFDLAMIGDRSSRRTQVERLLDLLGTPVLSWGALLGRVAERGPDAGARAPDPEPAAMAEEPDWDALLAQAIPDLAPATPEHSSVPTPADPPAAEDSSPVGEPRRDVEEPCGPWLACDAFRLRLDQAVERVRRQGVPFALHRFRLPEASSGAEILRRRLPLRLRAGDGLCLAGRDSILVLCAGPTKASAHLHRRVAEVWNQAWSEAGGGGTAPPLDRESVMLTTPAEAEPFLTAARTWLEGAG